MNSTADKAIRRPSPPPVYRPQPAPKSAQAKVTIPRTIQPKQAGLLNLPKPPVAPPAYRPQPTPLVLQTKSANVVATTGNRAAQIRVSAPIRTGKGSYRITVGTGNQQVGSVMVHERDQSSIQVTDLSVNQAHRKQGLGNALIASALRTGLQLGRTRVVLNSQDNGSGHLTRWYQDMGFSRTAASRRGYPQLEAPISRALSRVLQQVKAPIPALKPTTIPFTLSRVSPVYQAKLGPSARSANRFFDSQNLFRNRQVARFPYPASLATTIQMSSSSDDESDYQQNSDEELANARDENNYNRKQRSKLKKVKRPAKPKDLQKTMREDLESASSGDEKEIFEERTQKFPKTKYNQRPAPYARSRYKAICRRCGKPIYFNQHYKELGVIHDDGKRHEAPYGHRQDYATYQDPLAVKLQDLKDVGEDDKVIKKVHRLGAWDPGNLAYEHYDCNATAPKQRRAEMDSKQEDLGEKYVQNNFDRWHKEAKQ